MSKEERAKHGWVGKKEEIDPITGEKVMVDYEDVGDTGCFASVFTADEWYKLCKEQGRVKERIYSESGELIKEILREGWDDNFKT